LKGIWLN